MDCRPWMPALPRGNPRGGIWSWLLAFSMWLLVCGFWLCDFGDVWQSWQFSRPLEPSGEHLRFWAVFLAFFEPRYCKQTTSETLFPHIPVRIWRRLSRSPAIHAQSLYPLLPSHAQRLEWRVAQDQGPGGRSRGQRSRLEGRLRPQVPGDHARWVPGWEGCKQQIAVADRLSSHHC